MAQTSFIGRFFGFIGRSIDFIGKLISRLLLVLVIGLVLVMLFGGPEPLHVPDGGLVVLEPKGAIVEQPGLPDPGNLLLGSTNVVSTPLHDILDTLERAAADDRIVGVVMDLQEMTSISPANLETIGEALEGYKTSGKALIAHGEYFSQAQYLLASYADTIYLHPMGQVLLPGYGGSQLFFSELLDKLGVNVHIFRVGTHKAAVEPFSLDGMSDESRANSQQLVDELWERYLETVATNRGLSEQLLRSYTNDFADHLLANDGDTARTALDHGLVDELVSRPRMASVTRALVDTGGDEGRVRTIGFREYLTLTARPQLPAPSEVAIIVAQGTIDVGEQPRGAVGAESLIALIREARRDDRVKALVLRVDSPGGSALASELIRQELELVQDAGLPLVVSMGGTAASGGYWISAMADEIWASPTTVTGSIGIFGMIPTFEEGLASIGVYADGVSTTPLSRADIASGMPDSMARVFQASVEDGYRRFLRLVSEGRGMTEEEVDAIAQGQVWSGAQALEFGLVDNLGDLDDAVESAARLAGLTDYGVRYIDKPLTPGEQLLQEIVQNMDTSALLSSVVGDYAATLMQGGSAGSLHAGSAFAAWQRLVGDVSALARFNDPLNLYSVCELCAVLR